MDNNNLIKLHKNRMEMYKFLSMIYTFEVTEEIFNKLKEIRFPVSEPGTYFGDAYNMIKGYLDSHNTDSLIDLEADYAKTFLAAGQAAGIAAFPYESLYTGKSKLVNQEPASEAVKLYSLKGLKPREDMFRIPDDHIGLELDYMAHLLNECINALENNDERKYAVKLKEQKNYIRNHLSKWVPVFCVDVVRCAETDFYKGIGLLTRCFIDRETELFK